jgi:hypothetical protein
MFPGLAFDLSFFVVFRIKKALTPEDFFDAFDFIMMVKAGVTLGGDFFKN